jgi:hypothetical protein
MVLRPSITKDSRGQITGDPTVLATRVFYAYKPLSGLEREIARQEFASASATVTMDIDRSWGLTPNDYLMRTSGPHAGTRLNIGYIKDMETLGLNTEIIVGEGDLS